jgi:ferritin-like metal-binding protein YciE
MGDITKLAPGNNLLFEEFLLAELKDIFGVEKHLAKTLPLIKLAAGLPALKKAFDLQLHSTREHIATLEKVFSLLNCRPGQKKCEVMERITREGQYIIDNTRAGTATRDTGLIHTGQKAVHYKISTYAGLIKLAKKLGYTEVAAILDIILAEEKTAAILLTAIADEKISFAGRVEIARPEETVINYFNRSVPFRSEFSYVSPA